jgi:hypothetical protein
MAERKSESTVSGRGGGEVFEGSERLEDAEVDSRKTLKRIFDSQNGGG